MLDIDYKSASQSNGLRRLEKMGELAGVESLNRPGAEKAFHQLGLHIRSILRIMRKVGRMPPCAREPRLWSRPDGGDSLFNDPRIARSRKE
jgi:hypothetical protein